MPFPMIPVKTGGLPVFSVKCGSAAYAGELTSNTAGKPFFNILTDNGVANLFLEAVAANPDEAWAFVSKHYINAIDLEALRDVLGGKTGKSRLCKSVIKASYSDDPKNCSTRSVMVVDPDRNEKSILHLHMIKEPDQFGPWKIYGVEQE